MRSVALDRDLPQRRIAAFLEQEGIPHLDLLPILRAAEPMEDGQLRLYHLRDTHFNARGNAATELNRQANAAALAQARFRVRTGDFAQALPLITEVESLDPAGRDARARTLIETITRIETVYEFLDGEQRATIGDLSNLRSDNL